MFNQNKVKVANVEKHVDDDMEFIDDFAKFKTAFPAKSFIKSIYYQTPERWYHYIFFVEKENVRLRHKRID